MNPVEREGNNEGFCFPMLPEVFEEIRQGMLTLHDIAETFEEATVGLQQGNEFLYNAFGFSTIKGGYYKYNIASDYQVGFAFTYYGADKQMAHMGGKIPRIKEPELNLYQGYLKRNIGVMNNLQGEFMKDKQLQAIKYLLEENNSDASEGMFDSYCIIKKYDRQNMYTI